MKKFTDEEIRLCKLIPTREKKLKFGDWYYDMKLKEAWLCVIKQAETLTDDKYYIMNCFPLWTLSDAIEWLKEKDFNIFIEWDIEWGKGKKWWIGLGRGGKMPTLAFEEGSLLEACLKAILEILEKPPRTDSAHSDVPY